MANPVTTAQSGPWGPQADYLKYGLAASLNQLQQGLAPFYPDATVVGPTKGMQAGWDMQGNYITGDDAAAQQAAAQSALSGIFGTGGAAQQYGRSLMGPQTQAQFGAMTPFSGQQYGDLLAGKANLAGINPVVSAMGHDVMESFVPQLKRAQDMGAAWVMWVKRYSAVQLLSTNRQQRVLTPCDYRLRKWESVNSSSDRT